MDEYDDMKDGYDATLLGLTGINALRYASNEETVEPIENETDLEYPLLRGATLAVQRLIVFFEDGEGASWKAASQVVFEAFKDTVAAEEIEFKKLDPVRRFGYEAFARHVLNMLEAGPNEDRSYHEKRWHGWAVKKAMEQEAKAAAV